MVYMSSRVYIYIIYNIFFWIDFNPTGHVWLFGMLVSGQSKINFKSMTGHFIWVVVTETDWYCVIKKWMHSLHSDNKLDCMKVYRWLVATCCGLFWFYCACACEFSAGKKHSSLWSFGEHLCLCFYCLLRILASLTFYLQKKG